MANKMMEMFLDNEGFGIEQPKVSEVDALVFADDALLVEDLSRKDARAIRLQKTKNKKLRLEKLYNPSSVIRYAHRASYDRDDTTGIVPVFHGEDSPVTFIKKGKKNVTKQTLNKVANRKLRYQKVVAEPILEEDDTFNLVEEEDLIWQYQSLPVTENLGSKVWDAWVDYGFYVTMEAVGEFNKIAKSLKRLSNLNDTLQNDKLEQNILNLWDALRYNSKF